MKRSLIGVIACVLFGLAHAAQATNVVVGVNIWNESYLSNAAQDVELKQNGAKRREDNPHGTACFQR
jgi:hypothetical protein